MDCVAGGVTRIPYPTGKFKFLKKCGNGTLYYFLQGAEMRGNKVSWYSVGVDSVKKMCFLQKCLGVLVFVLLLYFLEHYGEFIKGSFKRGQREQKERKKLLTW